MKVHTPLYTGVGLSRHRLLVLRLNATAVIPAREKSTGRRVAIKKIKVGQFKDGLDMSAIREVKYLRELSHPNVIEVRGYILPIGMYKTDHFHPLNLAPRRIFLKNKPQPRPRVP